MFEYSKELLSAYHLGRIVRTVVPQAFSIFTYGGFPIVYMSFNKISALFLLIYDGIYIICKLANLYVVTSKHKILMPADQKKVVHKIHTFTSGEQGIFANAYIIETQNGLIVVDATLTVSESKSLKNRIDSINKPLLAILLTHAHPDHVAGVTNLVRSSSDYIPIVALESIEKLMRITEEPKRIQWGPVYKDEWIRNWTFPNKLVKDRETVTFDGITYQVHDIGPGGDSDANSIWVVENEPKVAFTGDLVFDGTHSYIADNHLAAWLNNLDKVRQLLADVSKIYPGHGNAGSLEMFDSQKKYLLAYSDAVKELANGKPALEEDAKKELTSRMEKFLPGAPLTFLIAHSANAVAAELASMLKQ